MRFLYVGHYLDACCNFRITTLHQTHFVPVRPEVRALGYSEYVADTPVIHVQWASVEELLLPNGPLPKHRIMLGTTTIPLLRGLLQEYNPSRDWILYQTISTRPDAHSLLVYDDVAQMEAAGTTQ